jgi:hypothetical protein
METYFPSKPRSITFCKGLSIRQALYRPTLPNEVYYLNMLLNNDGFTQNGHSGVQPLAIIISYLHILLSFGFGTYLRKNLTKLRIYNFGDSGFF